MKEDGACRKVSQLHAPTHGPHTPLLARASSTLDMIRLEMQMTDANLVSTPALGYTPGNHTHTHNSQMNTHVRDRGRSLLTCSRKSLCSSTRSANTKNEIKFKTQQQANCRWCLADIAMVCFNTKKSTLECPDVGRGVQSERTAKRHQRRRVIAHLCVPDCWAGRGAVFGRRT